MRGGFLHNSVLIRPIAAFFQGLGAEVRREHPVVLDGTTCYVDLFVTYGARRIVCEAELSTVRVSRDVIKAAALGAELLLIVVPNAHLARLARRRLAASSPASSTDSLRVWILPLGPAIDRLRKYRPFMTGMNVGRHQSQKDGGIAAAETHTKEEQENDDRRT